MGDKEDIRILPDAVVAYDCPECGARDTGKNLQEKKCLRCGTRLSLRIKSGAVILSGPTKVVDERGYWVPKPGGNEE